ncbi:MAG: hypothetical protein H0U13_03970 [Gemmatimonadaceae bacterium]|nr:hypothetical protein [Gemmatimonadaceae bacterium]
MAAILIKLLDNFLVTFAAMPIAVSLTVIATDCSLATGFVVTTTPPCP